MQQSPLLWKRDFKRCIDRFIKEHLDEKLFITAIPAKMKKKRSRTTSTSMGSDVWWLVPSKNGIWCSNPKHAAICAKLDSALVWQGRGYVSQILHAISLSNHLFRVNLRKFHRP
jgi:hypothetical protein